MGRILLERERAARKADESAADIPREGLRTAFTISKEHVLTAWHCVRDATERGDTLWFRLRDADAQMRRRYTYLPVRVLGRDEAFDVAVLTVDESRLDEAGLSEGEAAELLAGSVIPLGVDVSVYEQVRVMGFPANAPSADSDTHLLRVDDLALPVGDVTGMKLSSESFGAVDPVNPRGLSGGPVLKSRDTGGGGMGSEVAVGVVRRVPVGRYPDTALGGGLIATRIEDAAGRVPQIAAALRAEMSITHARRGDRLWEQGLCAEAAAAYRAAIALDLTLASAHAGLGDALGGLKRFPEAEACCLEATRLDPALPRAHAAFGDVLLGLNRFPEAEASCREAIRLDPTFARAYAGLGAVLYGMNRSPEAEVACQEAIRLDPTLAQAHSTLGGVLLKQEQFPEAEAACREAIRLDPAVAQAHARLGRALRMLKRYPEAEVACREAIRLDPTLASAYQDLGAVLHAMRRYPEAEAPMRTAVALNPANASAHDNLGAILFALKRYPEAEAACLKAIDLAPDVGSPHYNLSLVLRATNRRQEADAALAKACRLDKSFLFVWLPDRVKDRLDEISKTFMENFHG